MSYFPLRNHSHYSLLNSIAKCDAIVEKSKSEGYKYVGITDIATISGVVNFIQSCKSNDIKPIIGTEVRLKNGSTITLICKNLNAWKDLLNVISISNNAENFDNGAKIEFEDLVKSITPDNFICLDGYIGSYLFSSIMPDISALFNAHDKDSIREYVNIESVKDHVDYISKIFKDYYIEINNSDSTTFPILSILSEVIQLFDKDDKYIIPDSSSYYVNRSDAIDHRILLCIKHKTTITQLSNKINNEKDIDSLKFIYSSNYHIKPLNSIYTKYKIQHFDNMQKIIDSCEEIQILSQPMLPHFQTPNNISEEDYLTELCRAGWRKLINKRIDKSLHEEYKNRVLKELKVIKDASLAGYFLIVQDYVNHFRNLGYLVGPARGSAAGSLVAYLVGITLIDPIEFGLLFERFFNEGRSTKDHISLPDIDVDFPPEIRDDVIQYIKDKYGENRVCQMLTFGRLSGRSIIKEVLRVNEACSFDEINKITEKIPNESSISDLLEEMENPSVIRWILENDKNALIDYCWIDDNGELNGDYSKLFSQAMRMEGTFKTQGKHAAGVVIASHNLHEICPMVKASRSSEKIAGMEMGDLEAIGCVKFDILGVGCLQKIANTVDDINKVIKS